MLDGIELQLVVLVVKQIQTQPGFVLKKEDVDQDKSVPMVPQQRIAALLVLIV